MIPMTFDFFETRIHFEYLIKGTNTFAGVSKSTIGGIGSIVFSSFDFFNSASPNLLNVSQFHLLILIPQLLNY